MELLNLPQISLRPEESFRAFVKQEVRQASKAILMNSLRECAEYRGIFFQLPRNDRTYVYSKPASFSDVSLDSFGVQAKYDAITDKTFPWLITHFSVSSEPRNAPKKEKRETAYRDQELAAFVAGIIRERPGAERKNLVAVMRSVLYNN